MTAAPGESIRQAYDRSAGAWAAGPARIYQQLADALLAHDDGPINGRTAIDLGAGTGVVSSRLQEGSAVVVAVDVAHQMLLIDADRRPPAVTADGGRLPIRGGSIDLVVSAFCLNHAPDPQRCLREVARVLGPSGRVLVSTFAAGRTDQLKAAVDTALHRFGHRTPAWRSEMSVAVEAQCGDAPTMRSMIIGAGFAAVEATEVRVPVGPLDADALVAWRFGMASCAPFIAGLDDADRRRAREAALVAVGGFADTELEIPMLVTIGHMASRRITAGR